MSRMGLTYMAENLRGKIIDSSWAEHVDDDGTSFKLNTRKRETFSLAGARKIHTDRTLIVSNVGVEFERTQIELGGKLLETSIGWVCAHCLTSDHIKKQKNATWLECTRCGRIS